VATTTTTDSGRSIRDQEPEVSIRSLIPARLDRLGWSRFHTHLVIALGVAWVLDGLEITIASNAEGLISQKQALNLSSSEVAFAVGTVYLLGEVVGALFFGRMSDKFGRRNLFMITLGVYLFGGRAHRSDLGALARLVVLGVGLPLHCRHGHRG
jgi:MFS family permease